MGIDLSAWMCIAAIVVAIVFLVKYIKAKSEYLSWKKRELVIGEIGEETRRMPYNGGTKYIYHFTLFTKPEETKITYEDVVKANENPSV